jgi:hypothetical protein
MGETTGKNFAAKKFSRHFLFPAALVAAGRRRRRATASDGVSRAVGPSASRRPRGGDGRKKKSGKSFGALPIFVSRLFFCLFLPLTSCAVSEQVVFPLTHL